MAYTWTFEISFLAFLLVVVFSQVSSGLLRSWIPMPLIFGAVFIGAFTLNLFPRDMILSANMIAVGVIAYNVLVIHSGTLIDLKMLRRQAKPAVICLLSTLAVVAVVGFGLAPLMGRELALLAPGSILGGGASCAIASRWVVDKRPDLSVFPWLIFMFQGLFSVPVVTLAMKAETQAMLAELRGGKAPPSAPPPAEAPKGLAGNVPAFAKTTAYYLGGIMVVGVLNKLLHSAVLSPLGIDLNINVTALLLGLLVGQLGLMERGPLYKSDAYGLLLLGLMGLMANTMANQQLAGILQLLPALFLAFGVSSLLLIGCGALLAKAFRMRPLQGVILTMNSMMGFPVNGMLIANAARAGADEGEQAYLRARFSPLLGVGTMLISNAVSIFIVSILVGMV